MNPLGWTHSYRGALIETAVIGAGLGVVLRYFSYVYDTYAGHIDTCYMRPLPFLDWLIYRDFWEAAATAGAISTTSVVLLTRLFRR